MNKKQIAKLGVTLGLVGAVGVGGTLALLSAQSNVVTNTFAAGNGIDADTDITLFEHIPEENATAKDNPVTDTYNDGTSAGVDIAKVGVSYSNLEPNMTLDKDPAVQISQGTADCYLFVKVDSSKFTGVVGDVEIDGIYNTGEEGYKAPNWHLLDDDQNIYYYQVGDNKVIDTEAEAFVSDPLFETINLGMNAALYNADGSSALDDTDNIEIKAFIVQATENGNWEQAVELAMNENSWK